MWWSLFVFRDALVVVLGVVVVVMVVVVNGS
jgi:hypothetical protein